MDTETIDIIRKVFHYGSFVLLGAGIGLAVLGFFRPKAFKKVFHEFSQRRFIMLTSVFVCLLAGTIFTITYPASDTTLQSNAPKPATHGINDLKDIDDSVVPQDTVQAAEPKVTEQKTAGPTKPQPTHSPQNKPNSRQKPQTSKTPQTTNHTSWNQRPQQINPDQTENQQSKKDKNCKLELLFICL